MADAADRSISDRAQGYLSQLAMILVGADTAGSRCVGLTAAASPRPRQCRRLPAPRMTSTSDRRRELPDAGSKCSGSSRRIALLRFPFSSIAALFAEHRWASAFSIGISGPKDWLKDQKKKAARFVLAPIDASRQSLRSAYLMLTSESSLEDSGELRKLLNSAARDCVPQNRSSFVTFQASTGVEVCTFKLIVKNAASLLDDVDPVKLDAEAKLDDLIKSFSTLGATIDDSDFHLNLDRQKVRRNLIDVITALDKFEQGIKDCLGV